MGGYSERIPGYFIRPIKDFFFPPLCFACNNRLTDAESRVCSSCWSAIETVHADDYTVRVLRERFSEEGSVDDFHSCYYFEEGGVFQKLVHSLKYNAVTLFGVELGRHIGKKIQECAYADSIEGIVPIPLHALKQRERGYNQSEFICRGISEVLGSPVLGALVKRSRNTVSQTHLTADERRMNMEEAFVVRAGMRSFVEGKTLLVVDDVITTGSTIQAVAKILKENGAAKVTAASAALAKMKRDDSIK